MRVALKIAYIGTDFYGFQRQPGLPTVEGELLSALSEVGVIKDPDKCGFGIAGRTDRGVHALGNVISFLTEERIIINQINDALPNNIKILAHAKVPIRFKARYALQRHYRYLLVTNQEIHHNVLNLEKMIQATQIMIGTHDFTNFSKRSERSPIRTIDSFEVQKDADLIMVDVLGESFLWNMIRKIVSALLMIGYGDIEINKIYEFLNHQKKAHIKPMPPEGLILMDVNYAGVKFTEDHYAQKSFTSHLEKEYLKYQSIASSEIEMIKNIKNR
jgi:tRNA pseudouridine38-40 synthase